MKVAARTVVLRRENACASLDKAYVQDLSKELRKVPLSHTSLFGSELQSVVEQVATQVTNEKTLKTSLSSVSQEGNSGHRSLCTGGFLVPTIPGTLEDRRLASYYQLETSERSRQASEVQDGDPSLGPTLPYQGHVGRESGSQGCLSPRPCQPERPAIAEISGWGRGVSVPLPVFRPVHSSKGFHPSGQGGGLASETAGGELMCVPLGEISPGPHTVTHLPRCTLRPYSWSSSANTRSCRQSDQLCRTAPISASGRSFGVVASVGVDGELCGPNPTVQVPHATHSTSPIGSLSTVTTRGRSHGTGYPDNQGGPGVVDFQGSPLL